MSIPYREAPEQAQTYFLDKEIPPTWAEMAELLADIYWYQQGNVREPRTFMEKLKYKYIEKTMRLDLPSLRLPFNPMKTVLAKYQCLKLYMSYALTMQSVWYRNGKPFRPFTEMPKYDSLLAKYHFFLQNEEMLANAARKEPRI